MSISGKTCLVTGATSGLGLATSKHFAKLGANVVLLCRDKEKGENAITQILQETPKASLKLMICDLASMSSVRSFVSTFKAEYSKLDILFNNAAVVKQRRTITQDGFETMFQTNYLAPFMITTSLLGLLKESPSARAINIAVPSDKLRVDFQDLQFANRYSAFTSFFTTKLYFLLFSLELSVRPVSDGITVMIADPGPFKSNLAREAPWPMGLMKNMFSGSAAKAASNIVLLASSDELGGKSGKIYVKGQERPAAQYWSDQAVRTQLWSVTEKLINGTGTKV